MKDVMISRQAAIDALEKLVPYAIDDDCAKAYMDGLTDAYNLICQLPPAETDRMEEKQKEDENGSDRQTGSD